MTVLERENADLFTSDEIVARAIASESFPVIDALTVTQLTVLGMRADAHRLGRTVFEVGESKRLAGLVRSAAGAIADAVDAYHGADGHSVGDHVVGGDVFGGGAS